jgi:hypothetical protein
MSYTTIDHTDAKVIHSLSLGEGTQLCSRWMAHAIATNYIRLPDRLRMRRVATRSVKAGAPVQGWQIKR